jgi:hypothetical protein
LGLFGGPSASGSIGAVQQGIVNVDENARETMSNDGPTIVFARLRMVVPS